MVGGSCPNIACLPSKNFIHSAKVAAFAKRAQEFGLAGGPMTTDMKGVLRRKQEMVDNLLALHVDRFRTSGTELIMGEARFIGERTAEVKLNSGDTRVVSGENVILSLGTVAAIPDIPGLLAAKPMTHVEALELDIVPRHLIVLGAGYVGIEFAQAMQRFGSAVTILERSAHIIPQEDPDTSAAIAKLFRDEGIDVALNARIHNVQGRSGEDVVVDAETADGRREILGTHILVAAGRIPNTSSAGLDKARVELGPHGYIRVNERLETTADKVWAVGDCAGTPQFTHAAFDDFRVVRDNLSGGHRTTSNRLIPSCLFTDPELVRIGLNESQAKRDGVAYRLAKLPMAAVLRTRTVSEPRGFMKMLVDPQSDCILGFTAFGVEASELLAAVQTAMLGNLPYTVLRDAIYTHPTIAEGLVFLLANLEGPSV